MLQPTIIIRHYASFLLYSHYCHLVEVLGHLLFSCCMNAVYIFRYSTTILKASVCYIRSQHCLRQSIMHVIIQVIKGTGGTGKEQKQCWHLFSIWILYVFSHFWIFFHQVWVVHCAPTCTNMHFVGALHQQSAWSESWCSWCKTGWKADENDISCTNIHQHLCIFGAW